MLTAVRRLSGVLILCALFLLLAGCDLDGPSAAPESTPVALSTTPVAEVASPTATLMPVTDREKLFDDIWQTVDEDYLYPDFHGADWNALRQEYRPEIDKATSADEYYGLIGDMVDKLNDDHSYYIPPWDATEEDREEQGTGSFVGIGILTAPLDESILVVEVFSRSPAWKAGLRRGDHILAVDGVAATADNLDKLSLAGPEGSTVNLKVRSGSNPPRDLKIERQQVNARSFPTATRLDGNLDIGLLTITTLDQDDMDSLVQEQLQLLLNEGDLSGLIIDVRGNGGGLNIVLDSILGQFVTGNVGRLAARPGTATPTEPEQIDIDKGDLYDRLKDVPLVILVDHDTASNAEIMAATLQTARRARVVGVPTAGNTETIVPYDFDDGSRLWLAEYGFSLPDGRTIEGKGVTPDAAVDVDWTDYDTNSDPQIKKAVEIIRGTPTPSH